MTSLTSWTPETLAEWVDQQLHIFETQYQTDATPSVVSFRALCSQWPWAKRSDVFTHLLHRYPAKLLPYIPIFFLSSSYVAPDEIVLDPFAGTGTVLLESLIHPFFPRSCLGAEINPLARLVAQVKTTPLPPDTLELRSAQLYSLIQDIRIQPDIPAFPNRDFWFRHKVLEDIAKIAMGIELLEATLQEKDFFWACLSSIIRDVSWADPKVAPPVKLRAEKFPKELRMDVERQVRRKSNARVMAYYRRAVNRNIGRMRQLHSAWIKMPASKRVRSEIVWDDARTVKRGRYAGKGVITKRGASSLDGEVGLIITSPPYINAQKYIRTTKLELWTLGLESTDSIVDLDRSLIGTERIYQDEYEEIVSTNNQTADRLIDRIYSRSPEQAGVVSRYFRDMRQAITTAHRLLKKDGYLVMIIGDNTIGGQTVESHNILAQIAEEKSRFSVRSVVMDSIRSRGLITKRHATAGVIPEEWVIVMRKQSAR